MAENVSTPQGLDLLAGFINTGDPEGRDEIDTPEALRGWLRDHGLPSGAASPGDVRRAHAVREALRALLVAHNGGDLSPDAVETCNAAARRAPLHVVLGEDGAARLEPLAKGVDAALGRLLAIVERAQAEGTWERMKACAADDCRWAYYDRSRNRSRHWCDMASCGNRAKARTYRSRTDDR
jgi:predicted RNA-binding Zn ribbon-like protein